jgi:calcineurin-like phosphoesterase
MLAGSITTNKLANPFINISDESSTTGQVLLEQTLEFLTGEGIDTIVSGNTIRIQGELATDTNIGVANFPIYNSGTGLGNFIVTSGSVQISTIDGGTY